MKAVMQFFVSEGEKKLFLSLQGRGTMEQAYLIDRFSSPFLEKNFSLRFDLKDAEYLDSTFLGTLLHLNNYCRDFAVLNASDVCLKYFQALNIRSFFRFETSTENITYSEIPEIPAAKEEELARKIVDAHTELIRKNQQLSEKFSLLIERLRKDYLN